MLPEASDKSWASWGSGNQLSLYHTVPTSPGQEFLWGSQLCSPGTQQYDAPVLGVMVQGDRRGQWLGHPFSGALSKHSLASMHAPQAMPS